MKRVVLVVTVLIALAAGWVRDMPDGMALASEQAHGDDPKKAALFSLLYEADVSAVRAMIGLGLISCQEATGYYLERIEEYNEEYNCFITLCDDAAAVAARRDRQLAAGYGNGALFGVPVVIKDNMDLAGYPTTNGHAVTASPIAESNADVVEGLLAEGAVIIGKTNMSTDAEDARVSKSVATGETKNAYNTMLASGGSSGGSAVAVSLNFAATGLGTDTNSSLRIPSALNGCVSLRSTFGLVSSEGCVPLNATRDVPGAITRSAVDQAVMLDAITGGKHGFMKRLDGGALKGARLGILSELAYPQKGNGERAEDNLDDEVAEAFGQAVRELKACGAVVEVVSLPEIFALSEAALAGNAAYLKERLYEAFRAMMKKNALDAVIFPTYLTAPVKSGIDEEGLLWDAWAQPVVNNCPVLSPSAALPEMTVPIGNHSLGAGIGMEIAALRGREQQLLDLAYSYMEQFDHRKAPEATSDLYGGSEAASLDAVLLGTVQVMDAVGRQFGDAAKPVSPIWTAFLRGLWTLLAGVALLWMAWKYQAKLLSERISMTGRPDAPENKAA